MTQRRSSHGSGGASCVQVKGAEKAEQAQATQAARVLTNRVSK